MHLFFSVFVLCPQGVFGKGGIEGWIVTLYNFHTGSTFLQYFFLGGGMMNMPLCIVHIDTKFN